MNKILTAQQIRELDAYTIKHEPVSGTELMERAAHRLSKAFCSQYTAAHSADIYCGPGNNGGDGLVLARKLIRSGYKIRVFILAFTDKFSPDFKTNQKRLEEMNAPLFTVRSESDLPTDHADILVDAVFGSGLSRPVEGFIGNVLEHLNKVDARRIAVDAPSGLFAEDNDHNKGVIFKADVTYTFQVPKLAFMFAENAPYTGIVKVLPIGLDRNFIDKSQTDCYTASEAGVARLIQKRKPFSHKGTYGHACIAAGSSGKMGAAVLAAKSCLRSGVGLLTLHVPRCGRDIVQNTVPEAMCIVDQHDSYLKDDIDYTPFQTVGIGPGIGTETETRFMLEELITTEDVPLILDADSLNMMHEFEPLKRKLTPDSILTPHPGEFKRLFGDHPPVKRMEVIKEFTKETNCYILYKDHYSFLVTPEGECVFNTTGNSGMATGGSGDVLTGLLTGLKAQGYSGRDAAIIGMYLHGLAGDLAVRDKQTEESLKSGDIIDYLPKAWKIVQQNNK